MDTFHDYANIESIQRGSIELDDVRVIEGIEGHNFNFKGEEILFSEQCGSGGQLK